MSEQENNAAAEGLPVKSYTPTIVSRARQEWYVEHKKKVLDKIDAYIKAPVAFTLNSAANFKAKLAELVGQSGAKGINVHFGTKTKDKPNFVLIFVGTQGPKVNEGPRNIGDYLALQDEDSFEPIGKEEAEGLIEKYKNGVKTQLDGTVDDDDRHHGETEYVYFPANIVKEIIAEIEYQLIPPHPHTGPNISGIRVWIASYTDKETEWAINGRTKPTYVQRLTIQFGFVKDSEDLHIAEIDKERYRSLFDKKLLIPGDGFNTGIPIPPPL